MQLGLIWGYWARQPPDDWVAITQEAERLGYDTVWTSESWGSDAFSPLAHLSAVTNTIRLGTSVVQIAARPPTTCAMHAVTIDHLSNGRLVLGIGVSGPQVVEGWYGQPFSRPLARTREYVDVLRATFARKEHLRYDGEFYQYPYSGPGSTGLGKPLRIMTHPFRSTIPIFVGAEGPRNVAQTCALADGWLPLYYSPYRPDTYDEMIVNRPEGFEIPLNMSLNVTDDIAKGLIPTKVSIALYIGGMGAKGQNFHAKLMARMGFEAEANQIQELFLDGKRDEAIAAVPDDFCDEISLVGPPERIRDRLQAFEDSPITMLNVAARSMEDLHQAAELILG